MPPKSKFSREEITSAALDIIRENGEKNLTARTLAKRLNCSACPIFTVFESMNEVFSETVKKAKSLYGEYVKRGLKETPAFKGVGMEYINFAMKEARLFQLLFMREQPKKPTMETILPSIDENYEAILSSVKNSYNLSDEDSEKLYRHLWIYTHGIATLCATGMCAFTMEETGKMLTEVCIAILKDIKAEETK